MAASSSSGSTDTARDHSSLTSSTSSISLDSSSSSSSADSNRERSSLTKSYLAHFHKHGYVIIPNILNADQCQTLYDATLSRIKAIVFGDSADEFTDDDIIVMLTDPKRRAELLDDPNAIFRNGNSRQPLVSKSTGMTDQHYIPDVLENIAFNPRLYELASELYGCSDLVFRAGIERLCFKAPGATKMDEHIDCNPFDNSVNYGERIQCLVTTHIDTEVKAQDSGTLCLLTNFHHYWDFAGCLFHPHTGLVPFPDEPASWSRFFLLKGFGKSEAFLNTLTEHAEEYRRYCKDEQPVDPERRRTYRRWYRDGVRVPLKPKPLAWTPIKLNPGDAVFWNQRLPHYSCRNKSSSVRLCFYYSTFPTPDDWWTEEHNSEREWVTDQISEYRFSYGVQANRYPIRAYNPEEMAYLQAHPEERRRIRKLMRSKLARRLCALEPYDE